METRSAAETDSLHQMADAASIRVHRAGPNLFDLGTPYKVMLDGGVIGDISPRQTKLFPIGTGEFSLGLRFLFIRGSRELRFSLALGEVKNFICHTNWIGFPVLRLATTQDLAKMPSDPAATSS